MGDVTGAGGGGAGEGVDSPRWRVAWLVLAAAIGGCAVNPVAPPAARSPLPGHAGVRIGFSDRDAATIRHYYEQRRRQDLKTLKQHRRELKANGLTPEEKQELRHEVGSLAGARRGAPSGLAVRDIVPVTTPGDILPADLESRLSPLRRPYVRLVIGNDVILLNADTRVVFDVLRSVVVAD